jgi:hypothetical protein
MSGPRPAQVRMLDINFAGGLNENDSPWDIDDNELQELVNLDVNDDGLLIARRGFKRAIDTNNWLDPQGAIAANQPIQAHSCGALESLTGDRYVYASSVGTNKKILFTNDPSQGWTEVTALPPGGEAYSSCLVYNNVVYFPATTYSGVGMGNGFTFGRSAIGGQPASLAVQSLPKGEECFIIKDRMFVASWDESKVYYSKATDPTIWAAPDGGFFLVNPNDGGRLTGCIVVRDTLYIFKTTGIYQFTFQTDPATDGYLQRLTHEMGGIPAIEDNNIYFVNDLGCYALVNGSPQLLSRQLNWNKTLGGIGLKTNDYRIMAIPGRLIISRSGGCDGYSLNTRNGAWSRYLWNVTAGSAPKMPAGHFTDYCRDSLGKVTWVTSQWFSSNIMYFRDDYLSPYDYLVWSAGTEFVSVPKYRLQTKYFTLNERFSYKRFQRAYLDAEFNSPSDAGGINLRWSQSFNSGISHETRVVTNEAVTGPLTIRQLKFGNQRFKSMSFILSNSTDVAYYAPVGFLASDKDDTVSPEWYIRRISARFTIRVPQPT